MVVPHFCEIHFFPVVEVLSEVQDSLVVLTYILDVDPETLLDYLVLQIFENEEHKIFDFGA